MFSSAAFASCGRLRTCKPHGCKFVFSSCRISQRPASRPLCQHAGQGQARICVPHCGGKAGKGGRAGSGFSVAGGMCRPRLTPSMGMGVWARQEAGGQCAEAALWRPWYAPGSIKMANVGARGCGSHWGKVGRGAGTFPVRLRPHRKIKKGWQASHSRCLGGQGVRMTGAGSLCGCTSLYGWDNTGKGWQAPLAARACAWAPGNRGYAGNASPPPHGRTQAVHGRWKRPIGAVAGTQGGGGRLASVQTLSAAVRAGIFPALRTLCVGGMAGALCAGAGLPRCPQGRKQLLCSSGRYRGTTGRRHGWDAFHALRRYTNAAHAVGGWGIAGVLCFPVSAGAEVPPDGSDWGTRAARAPYGTHPPRVLIRPKCGGYHTIQHAPALMPLMRP